MEGLCWVLLYYYQGVPSWQWFYPYHYCPFASDLVDLHEIRINFEKGAPFSPLEQLMGVLPSARYLFDNHLISYIQPCSAHCLPPAYQQLMLAEDSPIRDFYPLDFKLDANGKKQTWLAVVLLPFIDQERYHISSDTWNHSIGY